MFFSTSGTFAVSGYDTRTVIDRAFGALGLVPQQVTGEKIEIAHNTLSLLLNDMLNTSTPLWCQQKVLITPVQGQAQYVMPVGTHDIIRAFYRTMNNVTPSGVTITSTAVTANFGTPSVVNSISVPFPNASAAIFIQTSPDGATWTTVAQSDKLYQVGVFGTIWFDVDNATPAQYWRITPQTGTFAVGSFSLYNTPADTQMYRMNRDQYWALPNKTFPGRPLQFWFDRQLQPVMNVWQVPDSLAAQNVFPVWRARLIQDVGTLQQQIEVPTRWFWTVILKLADALILSTPEAKPDRVALVQAKVAELNRAAWTEERDRSPVQFAVNLRQYTR